VASWPTAIPAQRTSNAGIPTILSTFIVSPFHLQLSV
jgi:hypothetical protein